MKNTPRTLMIVLALASAGLAACQKKEEPSVGQRVDQAIDAAKQGAKDAKADIKEATADAKAAGSNAANKVEAELADASITASVKTALAKDSQLSALSIDVGTSGGHVALKGTAPSEKARAHATQLAAAVKGVVSVDNRLSVKAGG